MNFKLLIVDDELEIRSSLKRRYSLKGYDVEVAENGQDALTKMEDTAYQIVISDIKMPVMDGIDLLRKIRLDYPMTRVIMVTGYVTMENALACLRHGAETVIFKPFEDLSELDNAIEAAFNKLNHWQEILLQLMEMKGDS